MPWGIIAGPMGLGECIWPGMEWDMGWPMLFIPMGLRAGFGPDILGWPRWLFTPIPGVLLGRFGERAGGESSSELATVLMASW